MPNEEHQSALNVSAKFRRLILFQIKKNDNVGKEIPSKLLVREGGQLEVEGGEPHEVMEVDHA